MYRLIVVDDDVDAVNNIAKDFPWEQSGFTLVGSFQDRGKCVGVAEDTYGRSDPLRHQNGPHERNRAGAADAAGTQKGKTCFHQRLQRL